MIELLTFIVPVLTVAVLLDLLIARSTGKRLAGYAASFLTTLIALPLAMFVLTSEPDFFEILIGLGIALMWWFIYLNFVQAVESSIRIRMLMEIQANGGSLALEDLQKTYNDDRLIRIRLNRLETAGAVQNRDGRHFLSSTKLRKAALFFTSLKRVILKKNSQFD